MSKRSILTTVASVLFLAACGQSGTAAPAEATGANETASSASIPAECNDNPLLAAMPSPTAIAGKPLTQISCQPFSVEMIWGDEMAPTKITLIDSKRPNGDLPPRLAEAGRNLPMQTSRTAILMTKGVQEAALAYPATLAELGGEDYLSVVRQASGGLEYALSVEPKDSGGQVGSLLGIAKERYALVISVENANLVGIKAGEAAYAPWLGALRLSALQ